MSLESHEDIQALTQWLTTLTDVKEVEGPTQKNNENGYHLEYKLYVDTSIDNPDIRINEIKKTLIPTGMRSKTDDYWFPQGDATTNPIIFCTGGLNPNARDNLGKHNL